VLAQRAASEGPRWTRAVEDQLAPIPEEKTRELEERIFSRSLRPCMGKGASRRAGVWRVRSLAFLSIPLSA
jgi:hypothetical protein